MIITLSNTTLNNTTTGNTTTKSILGISTLPMSGSTRHLFTMDPTRKNTIIKITCNLCLIPITTFNTYPSHIITTSEFIHHPSLGLNVQ